MAKTVEQIRHQIEKLQQQEKALLEKESRGVIARIREAVQHYKLTPEQIFGEAQPASKKAPVEIEQKARKARAAGPTTARVKAATVSKGTKIPAKFADKAGNSWSGRGSQPRWLRSAIESGAKLEDFTVSGS